jgi:capsular exopolysaccharide synthesis family protein
MVPAADETHELELRDYLRVLRRRKGVIVLAVLVVVAAALVASFLQTSVYQGTAELLLKPRTSESLFNPNTGQANDPTRQVQTEIQVLKSRPVKDQVRKQLGVAPDVSASPVGQTDVIRVKATSTDPPKAAAIANAYANAYIEFRRAQDVNDLLAAGTQVQNKINDLQKQLAAIDAQLAAAPPNQRAALDATLGPQRDSLITQQGLFKQKLDQLQVDASLKSGGAQLVTPASTPTSPIRPRPKRNAIIATAVGLIFGVGLAFLFEYLDDSIKSKDDLDRAAHGTPVLGLIPVVSSWRSRADPRVVSLTEPTSPAAEAYRTLRTSIQFMGLDRPVRTLQVTSPSASEGKTTTLANLGVALARAGQRVVIVCCDLRRPRIHDFFGLSNSIGFTTVLLGDASLMRAVQPVDGTDRLSILSSGPLPPNPSELLSSTRAIEVLTALQGEFDMVLVDCPPVLPVTDAAVLSARVDATLLVATADVTTRREVSRAIELLHQVDAPLVGTVLNGVSTEGGYGYSYGYYRYYGKNEPRKERGTEAARSKREAARKR